MSITKNSQWFSKYYPVRNNFVLTIQPFVLYNFRSFAFVFWLSNLQLSDSQFWLFSDVWYANIWNQWLFFWIENLNFQLIAFVSSSHLIKVTCLGKSRQTISTNFTTDHLFQLTLCTLCSHYYVKNSKEFWTKYKEITKFQVRNIAIPNCKCSTNVVRSSIDFSFYAKLHY